MLMTKFLACCNVCTQPPSENMCLYFSSPSTIIAMIDLGDLKVDVNIVCKVGIVDLGYRLPTF